MIVSESSLFFKFSISIFSSCVARRAFLNLLSSSSFAWFPDIFFLQRAFSFSIAALLTALILFWISFSDRLETSD